MPIPARYGLATLAPGETKAVAGGVARGRWELSIAYDSPRPLAVEVVSDGNTLARGNVPANLDFRGPTPPFPAATFELDRRRREVSFEVSLPDPPLAGRLLGAGGEAHIRGLYLAPVEARYSVPLEQVCAEYVDWYRPAG
jgi:hypothetical protein